MSRFICNWKASTREAETQAFGSTPTAGYVTKGNFYHGDDALDNLHDNGQAGTESHTLYHHVQDILFRTLGEQDMQTVKIHNR